MSRAKQQQTTSPKSVDGMVPPNDSAAEAAVLSAILLRGGEAYDEVADLVAGPDFYSEAHRRIFDVLANLAQRGQPIDVLTVGAELRDSGRLQQIGGTGYLTETLSAAPVITEKHLRAYAARVRSKARQRRLIVAMQESIARMYVGVSDDESEQLFAGVERYVGEICSDRHRAGFRPLREILPAVAREFTEAEERFKAGLVAGVSSGFDRLDALTGGLHDGDLTIVAARPGMGKTALVTGFLEGVAEHGDAGALFSCEMQANQIGARMACSRAWVNLQKARTGRMNGADWSGVTQAFSALSELSIEIDDTPGITLAEATSKLRRLSTKLARDGKRLGVAIFDYLQIMDLEEERGETRDVAIGRMTRGLKRLAKELSVPVVLLSQLNRGLESRENKRPTTADLRESGNIENDADNILMLYRDEYYSKEKSDQPGVAEVIITKQRNGPTGIARLGFKKEAARFYNLKDLGAPEPGEPASSGHQRAPSPPAGFFDDFERDLS